MSEDKPKTPKDALAEMIKELATMETRIEQYIDATKAEIIKAIKETCSW